MTNKPPLTREEIREYICCFADGIDETIAALSTDLKRDHEGRSSMTVISALLCAS